MASTILRTLYPLSMPRIQAAQPELAFWMTLWGYAWLPVNVGCLAVAAFTETLRARLG